MRAQEFVVRSGAGADCKTQCVRGQRGERCLRDESAAWLSRSARSDRSKFSAAVASSMRALPASSAACLRADASAAPAAAAFSLCAYGAARTIWAVQVSMLETSVAAAVHASRSAASRSSDARRRSAAVYARARGMGGS